MADNNNAKPDEDAALRARLDSLSRTLGGRGKVQDPPASRASQTGLGNAMGAGFKVVTELVAGVMVGGGLGWLLDKWFHTKPVIMIIMGSLGLAGGFWNIVREAMLPPSGKSGR